MNIDTLNRRGFIGAAAGAAAAGALGPLAGTGLTKGGPRHAKGPKHGHGHGGDLPHENIGMQLWTVRGLANTENFGLEGTFEMLADAGYASVEVGGNYHGNTAAEFKALADEWGLGIAGSHVPGGQNAWRNNIGQVLDEAETLGLRYAGVAIPAGDVPRTVDGYRAMAEEFNQFGEAALARGIKFYFHNHPDDFTIDNGTVIYDVLLEETDPSLVWFELDIAWIDAGGQSAYEYIRENPWRYPLFHVKDLEYRDDGVRETPAGVAGAGRRFNLTPVGKGEIDFAKIFSALKNPKHHQFLVEEDDAPNAERNPAGESNTSWFSRKHLAELEIKRGRRRGRGHGHGRGRGRR